MKYIDADRLSPAEEWRVYPYNANYEVSNVGRVRNKKRKNILSQRINYSGYYVVTLSESGSLHGRTKRVHRLVAETFITNPSHKLEVNHLDGNKLNNNVSNLEWATPQENMNHALNNGLLTPWEYDFTVVTKEQLVKIHGLRMLGLTYKEIGDFMGVCPTAISKRIQKKSYRFHYSDDEFNALVEQFIKENKNKYSKHPRKPTYGGVPKKVIQKNLDGKVVAYYNSVTEASKKNNIARSAISNNLNGYTKICGGYKYEYE